MPPMYGWHFYKITLPDLLFFNADKQTGNPVFQ